jgi:acetyl-CoA carboxylase biotin carboxyl carrier protein
MPSDQTEFDSSDDTDVFDIGRVRQLIELMKEHELSEIDLRNSSRRIRLRSGSGAPVFAMPSPSMVPVSGSPAAGGGQAAVPPADDENVTVIKSPMVGTFYTSPKPGEPPFVKIGDQVHSETIVCIIEAMKMFNEIPAGISGKVVGIVAKNEEPVDVGRPLFRIVPD